MNIKEIKEIINLMNENELLEVEIEREGEKLKLKKSADTIGETMNPGTVLSRIPAQVIPAPAAPAAPASTPAKTTKSIISPMVGTFYRAPSPDAPPFVDIGQVVEIGQVVCIVEAMKLMNEIKSEVRGKVVNITVENAQPVEFGQVLFEIEPLS